MTKHTKSKANVDESVYKLNEYSLLNEGSSEAHFNARPKSLDSLFEKFHIKIIEIDTTKNEMEFDMIGIGPAIANAIRRILIAEIPTMAIDKIHMYNNTTILPDEVLTHRIGLIPIKVDPRLFVNRNPDDEDEGTEEDTLQFELKIKCTRKANVPKDGSLDDKEAFNNSRVYSKDLRFLPIGNQKNLYGDIRPVEEDILIAVLKPGHEIDLKAFCYKNIGREHAKFSPVVIASYRLMPQLTLLEEITGERACTLEKLFPGVIKVSKKKDREIAKVVNPRKINCNRNILLHEELKDVVEVSKIKDHYIFTVESVGALSPEVLVSEAFNVLKEKCRCFLSELKSLKM